MFFEAPDPHLLLLDFLMTF